MLTSQRSHRNFSSAKVRPAALLINALGHANVITASKRHYNVYIHDMGMLSALLALCGGNPLDSPPKGPVMCFHGVAFVGNKWLNRHSKCRWFEIPCRLLLYLVFKRTYNVYVIIMSCLNLLQFMNNLKYQNFRNVHGCFGRYEFFVLNHFTHHIARSHFSSVLYNTAWYIQRQSQE